MAKRLKIDAFVQLLAVKKKAGLSLKKTSVKAFAGENDVMVPSAFWKDYKLSYGKYGIPKDASIDPEEDVINSDDSTIIPDEEFSIEISNNGHSELIKLIKVIDKITGHDASTTIRADASEESINNIFQHYKKKLRHIQK